MLSRKTIEAYLFFLLRHKVAVSVVVTALTVFLAWTTYTKLVVQPDFASMYTPKHPYIQLYNQYRNMFGTAFTVQIVVEAKKGTIFDSPDIVQKVDRITLELLHDIPGVLALMGGRDPYNAKLDEHFAGHHNQHSNEPSHHYGYLYDFSGQPWKTQAKVREIAAAEYANQPSGIDGDDDCGQMSAWYIFTAFGFYPVNPASAEYMIGSPLFTRMSLRLDNGKTFTVIAKNNSATNKYIQSATLNGNPLNEPIVTYAQITQGATLEFVMGPQPSKWASNWNPKPIPTTSN